jgi:glycosyltransferase involved in cell wall biosynthesis
MRLLELGEYPFISAYAPTVSDFYNPTKLVRPGHRRLDWPAFLDLRRKLRAGAYDLVVYHLAAKITAPWHRARGPLSDLAFLASSAFQFNRVAWHFFHRALRDTNVPLVVVDRQDSPRITRTEVEWLDRCQFWFMRELPTNHLNLFLNMDSRCGDITNIARRDIIRRNLAKIEPFSIGFDPSYFRALAEPEPEEKIHDVFYIGRNHVSTVRERGIRELQALRDAGRRILIPEERLPKEEFFRTCSRAWLVWSPEGQGWNCFRHYDALMSYSVPLINSPTIEQREPLRHGEHCIYYAPESGGLTRAIDEALQDRPRLLKISAQGRAHILEHHTLRQLTRHVLAKVGLLEQAEKAEPIVDGGL